MWSAVTPTGWRWLDVDDALALRPALRSFPPNLWIKKSASVFLLLIAATSKRSLASRHAKARLAFADHGTPSQMVVDGKCDHAPRHFNADARFRRLCPAKQAGSDLIFVIDRLDEQPRTHLLHCMCRLVALSG